MLQADESVLVVIDVQGKLAQLMHEKEALFDALSRLVRGAVALELPVLWMEQNPGGLGATVPEVASAMPGDLTPIPKTSFSCWGEPGFIEALEASARRQVVLCGIEAHVCVYQTARDLLEEGYEVYVVADAVSSRKVQDREVALGRMAQLGTAVTTMESALFEMLGAAEGPAFKEILGIVK